MGWSAANIPDQTGRTVIITGANSGLGEQTALALAGAGAQIIMACRNVAKAEAVARTIGSAATVAPLDLADLDSVRTFAEGVDHADILINNAGVMAPPLRRTRQGFEMQMGTNHLGHFALTAQLLPKISERVVTVSSGMHQIGRINLDDLNWEKRKYQRWLAYGDSKMANLMFGKELAARLSASGRSDTPKASMIAHPGYAATDLQGHTESFMDALMTFANKTPLVQSAADGALPSLYAATSPSAISGGFYGPTALFGLRGAPGSADYRKKADDAAFRARLWEASEELTGVSFSV